MCDLLGVGFTVSKGEPKTKGEGLPLTLSAPTERRACLAAKKLKELVAAKRVHARVTHFISLPMSCPEIVDRYGVYRHMVKTSGYKTIDDTLFISQQRLHITLLVLRLFDSSEEQAAAQALRDAAHDIYDAVDTRCLLLHLKGNSCFSDDPSDVAVVFAPLYSR